MEKNLSVVDWNLADSKSVYNKYRALYGLWPLITSWHGIPVKLLKLSQYQTPNLEFQFKPGQILYDKQKHKLGVKCGGKRGGYMSIEKLKIHGHKTMSGKDFFNGFVNMKPNNEWKFDSIKQSDSTVSNKFSFTDP